MIKTVVSTYGEYIGDIVEDADVVVIKKPKMVIQSEQGFGFAKGVCVTSVESPEQVSIQKSNVYKYKFCLTNFLTFLIHLNILC